MSHPMKFFSELFKSEAKILEEYGQQLFSACQNNDLDSFSEALTYCGPHINELEDSAGKNILAVAAEHGRTLFVSMLLAAGADPLLINAKDDAKTPAHYAASNLPIWHADTVGVLKMLASFNPAAVETPDRNDHTPLRAAIESQNLAAVQYLVSIPVSLDFQNASSWSPLQRAAVLSVEHPKCVDIAFALIHAGANTAGCASSVIREIYRLKKEIIAHRKLLVALLKNNPSEGTDLLSEAIAKRDFEAIKLLTAAGADVRTYLTTLILQNQVTETLHLLKHLNFDINQQNAHGVTFLYVAAAHSDPAMLAALLQYQAKLSDQEKASPFWQARDTKINPNLANAIDGETPMHAAARRGDAAMIRALCDAGGLLTIADHAGNTPLHTAETALAGKSGGFDEIGKASATPASGNRPAA